MLSLDALRIQNVSAIGKKLAFEALDILRDSDNTRDALHTKDEVQKCWPRCDVRTLMPMTEPLPTLSTLPAAINVTRYDDLESLHNSSVQHTPAMPPPITTYLIVRFRCEQWAYIQLCWLSWTSSLLHTTSEQEVNMRWTMTAISQHLKEPKVEENMCHAGRLCSPRFF